MTWEEFKKKKEEEKNRNSNKSIFNSQMSEFSNIVKNGVSNGSGRVTSINELNNINSAQKIQKTKNISKRIGDTAENIFKSSSAYKNNNKYLEKDDLFNRRINQTQNNKTNTNKNIVLPNKDIFNNQNNKRIQNNVRIPSYKDFENANKNIILPSAKKQKENKATWGDKLANGVGEVSKMKLEDIPKIGKTAISEVPAFGMKALKQMEQVRSANSDGYRNYKENKGLYANIKEAEANGTNIRLAKKENKYLTGLSDKIGSIQSKQQELVDTTDSAISRKIMELTPSMVDSGLGMALNKALPGAGSISQFLAFGNDYYEDAKDRGMTDKQAVGYSGIMSFLESGTEKIGQDLTKNIGKSIIKGNSKKALKDFGIDIAENFFEEAVMEPLQELTASYIGGIGKADFSNMLERMLSSGIDGGLTSVFMGGISAGVGSALRLNKKIQSGNQINQEELAETFRDLKKQGIDVQKLFEQGVRESINLTDLIEKSDYSEENKEKLHTIVESYNLDKKIENNKNSINQNTISNEIINNSKLNYIQKNKLNEMTEKYNLSTTDIQDIINKFVDKTNINVSNSNIQEKQIGRRGIELTSENAKQEIIKAIDESNLEEVQKENLRQTIENSHVTNDDVEEFKKRLNALQENNNDDTMIQKESEEDGRTEKEIKSDDQRGKEGIFSDRGRRNYDTRYNDVTQGSSTRGNREKVEPGQSEVNPYRNTAKINKLLKEKNNEIRNLESKLKSVNTIEEKNILNNQIKQVSDYYNTQIDELYSEMDGTRGTQNNDTMPNLQTRRNREESVQYARNNVIKAETELQNKLEKISQKLGCKINYYKDDNSVIGGFADTDNSIYVNTSNEKEIINLWAHEMFHHLVKSDTNFYNNEIVPFVQDVVNNSDNYSESIRQYLMDRGEVISIQEANQVYGEALEEVLANYSSNIIGDYKIDISEALEPEFVEKFRKIIKNKLDLNQEVEDTSFFEPKNKNEYNIKYNINKDISEQRQSRLEELKKIDTSNMPLLDRIKIKHEIKAIEGGFDTVKEWRESEQKKQEAAKENAIRERAIKLLDKEKLNKSNIEDSKKSSFSIKEKQLEIIQKNNPAFDDYHTWIRNLEDINTADEVFTAENFEEVGNPDFTLDMAKEALKRGQVKVYSSYPIKEGIFVSPSKMEAESYSGTGKVYEKVVDLKDVAWIDNTQGQYAKVDDIKFSINKDDNINQETEEDLIRAFKLETQNIGKVVNEAINETDSKEEANIDSKKYIVDKRKNKFVPMKELYYEWKQKWVDKGTYLEKLAKKSGNKALSTSYYRMRTAMSEAQVCIGKNQTDINGKVIGKSLVDIFKPAIKNKVETEFYDYLLNKHNIARYKYEKGVYGKEISSSYSQKKVIEYEKSHPEFKQWAEEVYKYNRNSLHNRVEAGLISKETEKQLLELYDNYVPTYREMEEQLDLLTDSKTKFADEKQNKIGNNTLQKATGGTQKILNPLESMAEMTIKERRAIRTNDCLLELSKSLGKEFKVYEGLDFDPRTLQTLQDSDIIRKLTNGDAIGNCFVNGSLFQLRIPKDVFTAFDNEFMYKVNNGKFANSILGKSLENANALERSLLTTYSVGFALRNGIKDFFEATVNTKNSIPRFLANYGFAAQQIIFKGKYHKLYKNNGGMASSYFSNDSGVKLPTYTKMETIKNGVTVPIKVVNAINDFIEELPRLSEFISSVQTGSSIEEAMFDSADITTDFSRGGDHAKFVNKYFANFLNASIQGTDKLIRTITGQRGLKGYASLIVKATLFNIAPQLIHDIVWGDDDDYQNLEDYIKDEYWILGKTKNKNFIRIPKGRTQAVISSAIWRSGDLINGRAESAGDAYDGYLSMAMGQMAPNNFLKENLASPIIQAIFNKSWFGTDIVSSSREENYMPYDQYDEKTDKFSKWLGNKLGISPKKINYVIDQYSGGVGDIILPALTPYAEDGIFTKQVITDSVAKNKNIGDFYDYLGKISKKVNDSRASESEIDNYKLQKKNLESVKEEINDLYKAKREIQNSEYLSDKQKREQSRNIQKQINQKAESALKNNKSLAISGDYQKVGNESYYKNDKGNWTKSSESSTEDTANFTEKQKETYYKIKADISEIKADKDKDGKVINGSAKKKKLKYIDSLNLNDNDRVLMIESFTASDNDKEKTAYFTDSQKAIYYKIQTNISEMKADRDSNGDVIVGSAKEKKLDYINSLGLDDVTKAIMVKNLTQIKYDDYNEEVINYVYNLDISDNERKKMLENMGFKVKGDSISW